MQQTPESQRNHALISALFPHLPQQRFSWRALISFAVFSIGALTVWQHFIARPNAQATFDAQQAALAPKPVSAPQFWLRHHVETEQWLDMSESAPLPGRSSRITVGLKSSVTLTVKRQEGVRALLSALDVTGPVIPAWDNYLLPATPGTVHIMLSNEYLTLSEGEGDVFLTWESKHKKANPARGDTLPPGAA